jgi:membrane associated rhomboid family serine protease
MGIQDRDYYREGPSFLDRMGQQGATVWLIAITVGIFFGQMLSAQGHTLRSPLVDVGAYDPDKIAQGEVWRLFTTMFLHADFPHLFLNMLVLFWAGSRVEEVRGSREFVLLYLFAGVASSLFFLAAQFAGLTNMSRAVGASGAISAVLIVFACYFPRATILLFFVIPMPAWMVAVLFVGFDCVFAFGDVGQRGRVAYFGHLGGAFFGLLYFVMDWEFRRMFMRRAAKRARPKLRVLVPPVEDEREAREPVGAAVERPKPSGAPADEQLEAKLDAVLDKVSKYGQESLTAEEREILFKASELYKKRRK